jgi:hypothetical protein
MGAGQQDRQQLGDELLEKLAAMLPEASQDVLGELVRAVLHPGQEEPRDVIGRLLGQGCESAAVQRALSEARDFALARLLPSVLPQASPDMMKMVYAFLAHGDRLHRGLLQALSRHSTRRSCDSCRGGWSAKGRRICLPRRDTAGSRARGLPFTTIMRRCASAPTCRSTRWIRTVW